MQQAAIEDLLPSVFRRTLPPDGGGPLGALLAVMAALQEPSEAILGGLDGFFDARHTPVDAMVPYLAAWLDLDRIFLAPGEAYHPTSPTPLPAGLGYLRELVARGAWIAQWTGTGRGLVYVLETATGCPGFAVEESGRFHLVVRVPAAAAGAQALVDRVMRLFKPAYATYELAPA